MTNAYKRIIDLINTKQNNNNLNVETEIHHEEYTRDTFYIKDYMNKKKEKQQHTKRICHSTY